MITPALRREIQQRVGASSLDFHPVSGGSINETYRVESTIGKRYFCKCNSATKFPHLFETEIAGLNLIATQQTIRTPAILDHFEKDGTQVLLLEWIWEGDRSVSFWNAFGEQLAQLHRVSAESFGLATNNYMGAVPQCNRQTFDWCHFFEQNRLLPLVEKCRQQSRLQAKHLAQFEQLYTRLDSIFEPSQPSLLHGDLCGGNFMCNAASQPALIDPAVYFGHRSMDLAMTTLFGGFAPEFYDAYNYYFPLPSNYKEQWQVCSLYPLLIHLHLFGNSYLSQIEQTLSHFA